MLTLLLDWLASRPFIPHGHCYLWQPGLVGLHALSDGLITLAYGLIAAALLYFVWQRQDVPFRPIFLLFAGFIAACGLTHGLSIWTLWFPTYWVSGLVKASTALISLSTALTLIPMIPLALVLPSPTRLEQLNQALQAEIEERKQVEASLRAAEREVRQLNQELEDRVQRRTAQLEAAKQRIEELLAQEQQDRLTLQAAKDDLQIIAERLNLALDAAQMGSWDWHLDQPTLFWSPQTERILGLLPNSAPHTLEQWADQVHPDDLPRVSAAIEHSIAACTEFREEYRVKWPDGRWHWVSAYGRVVTVVGGESHRMAGVIQDITERKHADLALQASETRFRAVFEQAAVGMARLSPEGHWIQVNQKLCEMLGYAPTDLLNQHFSAITFEADHRQDDHYYSQLITGEQSYCQFEKRYLHRDGHPLWTLVTASVESEASAGISAFIAIIEDIEERKAARDELLRRAEELLTANLMLARTTALLERRNSELDQFAYVTSHDLKAPLRAISNLAEWIGEDLNGQIPEENQRQLALLRSRVQRMESLINGLLEYSQVGRRERQLTQVDVGQLVHGVIDSLAPPEGFQVIVADDMPTVYTHQTALGQVFANLINNAIKHHHREQGTVRVSWQRQGDAIEFAVADDGPGIASQYHGKIFTIFQTLKARDNFESTGIGLSVVKKIVESENGRIWLTSEVGQGTTFYFTWPYTQAPVDKPPQPTEENI
ncbi:MAG: PAS domain S-box protein [Leptolyngbyaceae cyanobacterium SM2_5_2]|nr:PAS domain S-box protein [Leptolyngbyaceae cyanobacterium SM2_5_2]